MIASDSPDFCQIAIFWKKYLFRQSYVLWENLAAKARIIMEIEGYQSLGRVPAALLIAVLGYL